MYFLSIPRTKTKISYCLSDFFIFKDSSIFSIFINIWSKLI
nr:MAG TPA: hypothetical protein [Crassvirales sp.]